MSEIVKGALDGGWSLLVGWLLPTAVNVVLAVLILSGSAGVPSIGDLVDGDSSRALVTLGAVVVCALVLAALQTPLYRLLEGYLGWPEWLFRAARDRMLYRKHLLADRISAWQLHRAERDGTLDDAGRAALTALRTHPVVGRYAARDARVGAPRHALLRERLFRFPVDDDQVVATRLGNAIRRFEEYGHDRFRLDSQVLWYELSAVAPELTGKQVDRARTTVDFFVCLLYGHLIVALTVTGTLVAGARPWSPVPVAAVLLLVAFAHVWYRIAVVATDDWAAAVRAMVNVGRRPLTEALGLRLPGGIAPEREMWSLVSKLARLPFDPRAAALDRFRATDPPASTDGPSARHATGGPAAPAGSGGGDAPAAFGEDTPTGFGGPAAPAAFGDGDATLPAGVTVRDSD
ncbi:hypothetical protein [Rugosimonospora africana]|uniref:Uncharacterized protein n=1 Tax=Rugosimonospora africana TaxID=556532 RepID=A0A8J3QVK0_9ACTN|nr:hypothetical protein [Rugosimonospora africana]GIH15591.1 hypothetical protein Raf01_37630 [Rugosimonospora africana]